MLKAFGAKPISFAQVNDDLSRGGRDACSRSSQYRRLSARGAAGGQRDPLRRRAGHFPRYRSRHVSVRHVVEHDRGRRLHRFRRAAASHGSRGRRDEGLHHARGRRAVADRERGDSPTCCTAWAANSARPPDARGAAVGSMPWPRRYADDDQRHRRHRGHQSRRPRHASIRSRSASATGSTANSSKCRRATPRSSRAASRFTSRWPAGSAPRSARAR